MFREALDHYIRFHRQVGPLACLVILYAGYSLEIGNSDLTEEKWMASR